MHRCLSRYSIPFLNKCCVCFPLWYFYILYFHIRLVKWFRFFLKGLNLVIYLCMCEWGGEGGNRWFCYCAIKFWIICFADSSCFSSSVTRYCNMPISIGDASFKPVALSTVLALIWATGCAKMHRLNSFHCWKILLSFLHPLFLLLTMSHWRFIPCFCRTRVCSTNRWEVINLFADFTQHSICRTASSLRMCPWQSTISAVFCSLASLTAVWIFPSRVSSSFCYFSDLLAPGISLHIMYLFWDILYLSGFWQKLF